MKIVKLQAENVKKIKAVEITPDGNVIKLSGKNAQGKSSILDAIWLALGGGKADKETKTDRPIRDGAESAVITLDLGDYIVKRNWTSNENSYLKVETKDGAKYSSPQKLLDAMVGQLSFDPLAFSNMDNKKQLETLLGLVDLEIVPAEIDKERKEIFNQRTIVNREADTLEKQLAARLPISEDLPEQELSTADIFKEMKEAQETIERNNDKRRELQDLSQKFKMYEGKIVDIDSQIDELKNKIASLEASKKDITTTIKNLKVVGKALKEEVELLVNPDMTQFSEKLALFEETNNAIREARETRKINESYEAKKKESEALTSQIKGLDLKKETALKSAKFPIEGLGFDENGVTFNGMSFGQCSKGEQIKVSFAMAMALNPDLKVIRITDGSLLDEDNLKMIEEMAAEKDFQVWIEMVDSTGKVGIYIEDGEVKKVG